LGVLALYSSVCLYESEEGRVQTRLEGLWLGLTDRRTSFVSRHYNTVQNLAWVASRTLDRIFGKRAISRQFMAASLLLSFASLNLGVWLAHPRLGWDSFIWGSAFALVAIAPLFSRRLAVVPTLASAALLINLLFALVGPGLSLVRGRPIERPLNPNFLLMWGLAVPLCLASSVAVLGALRLLLRSAAEEESLWRAAAKLVGVIAVTAVVVGVPLWLASLGEAPAPRGGGLTMQMGRTPWRSVVAQVADMNLFTILPALLYALGTLSLLCHTVAWEGILRPIYAAQRFRPFFTYRKTVFSAGLYLVAFAFAPGLLSPSALVRALLRIGG